MSVSDRAEDLQNSNGRFGDVVALNLIVVALDKGGGLTAIGDVIAAGEVVVTGQINPHKNRGIRNIVGVDFGLLAAREDANLVCGDGLVFYSHTIRLKDQDASVVKRTIFERNTRRPHVVGIVQDDGI